MKWMPLDGGAVKKLAPALQKYKYVLLVILAGVLLLLLPGPKSAGQAAAQTPGETYERFDLEKMEEKVSSALSQIDGAGKVAVVLTLKAGTRQILAQDGKNTTRDTGAAELTTTTVVVSRGSGIQETVILQEIYPQFQGALVVSPGAGDPVVRLKLSEAVTALTGLGADKISICKGK